MQKEAISRIMEDSKRNQKRAAKLIQKVMRRSNGSAGAGRRRRPRAGNNNRSEGEYGEGDKGDEDLDVRSSSATLPTAVGAQVTICFWEVWYCDDVQIAQRYHSLRSVAYAVLEYLWCLVKSSMGGTKFRASSRYSGEISTW